MGVSGVFAQMSSILMMIRYDVLMLANFSRLIFLLALIYYRVYL